MKNSKNTFLESLRIPEKELFQPAVLEWLSLIHISEPTRLGMISYAVFCLKKNEQQLMSSNYFQRMLTDLKQFFGNRKYNWREVLPTMLSVSTALSQLNTEFLKREKIRRFVQDNIKEMVVAVRENRDLKKSLERAIGTVKLKSQVRDNIAYLYLRIPATEGDIKSVEQKIYMLGPRKGTFAYSKPLGDNEDDKMENREKIEKECQHSRTINEGNFTNVIEVERVYSRKDKKKLKGTETKWMDKGTLLDLTLACLQNPSELSEEQRHWLAICIAKGLACIHDRNLVHLDLLI